MEQFLAVAAAHFLALLVPGVDFFLVARTAMSSGWRSASGMCVGIATANAVIIATAFSGTALASHPLVHHAIQVFGGIFLLYVGLAFVLADAEIDLSERPQATGRTWLANLGLGLTSGLLNPKNYMFYVSLSALLVGSSPLTLVLYGTWMAWLVLSWDLFVAFALGSWRMRARLTKTLPWLTRLAGVFLLVFGLGMLLELAAEVLW